MATKSRSDFVGEYVIVRCRDAGVHFGKLDWWSDRTARLSSARRLWRWKAGNGELTLSGVARHGVVDSESIIPGPVDVILTETCEIILCSDSAIHNLSNATVGKAT